jgi:hypothetical protein
VLGPTVEHGSEVQVFQQPLPTVWCMPHGALMPAVSIHPSMYIVMSTLPESSTARPRGPNGCRSGSVLTVAHFCTFKVTVAGPR